jgi:hypothetical protein
METPYILYQKELQISTNRRKSDAHTLWDSQGPVIDWTLSEIGCGDKQCKLQREAEDKCHRVLCWCVIVPVPLLLPTLFRHYSSALRSRNNSHNNSDHSLSDYNFRPHRNALRSRYTSDLELKEDVAFRLTYNIFLWRHTEAFPTMDEVCWKEAGVC